MKVVRKHRPWGVWAASAMRLCFTSLGPRYWRDERKEKRLDMVKRGGEYFGPEEHAMWAPGEMLNWHWVVTPKPDGHNLHTLVM